MNGGPPESRVKKSRTQIKPADAPRAGLAPKTRGQ